MLFQSGLFFYLAHWKEKCNLTALALICTLYRLNWEKGNALLSKYNNFKPDIKEFSSDSDAKEEGYNVNFL